MVALAASGRYSILMNNANKTVFGIIRHSNNGRTWYQSKNVGEITCRTRNLWTTTDRAAADRLAAEVGGTVARIEW